MTPLSLILYLIVPLLTVLSFVGRYERLTSTPQWCCYYGQHYHNCYTGKAGCDIGSAIAFQVDGDKDDAEIIQCASSLQCPGVLEAGFFLRGFRLGCPECQGTPA
jgi:hypothetical protein